MPEPASGGSVTLVLPADSAFLALARVTCASLCARLDFPVDRLDEVTLAVDEAVGLLLLDAVPGSEIRCRFTPGRDGLSIALRATSRSRRAPRPGTFAWTVLTALVDDVTTDCVADTVTVRLTAGRVAVAAS